MTKSSAIASSVGVTKSSTIRGRAPRSVRRSRRDLRPMFEGRQASRPARRSSPGRHWRVAEAVYVTVQGSWSYMPPLLVSTSVQVAPLAGVYE